MILADAKADQAALAKTAIPATAKAVQSAAAKALAKVAATKDAEKIAAVQEAVAAAMPTGKAKVGYLVAGLAVVAGAVFFFTRKK